MGAAQSHSTRRGRATFASLLPFVLPPSFAGLIVAPTFALQGIDPGPTPRQRNYVQGKVYPRFRSSFRPRREREREIALLFSSLVVGIVDFERNFIC